DNAAELLALSDLWCLAAVKQHVLTALRRGLCNSFRRPTGGAAAAEAVPQVAVLVRQALEYGLGDADGGLGRLYDDCTAWMGAWPARVWPTRTFSSMRRDVQEDVLVAAQSALSADSAPAALAACRHLASALPSVAWAARVRQMQEQLSCYGMSYAWGNFAEVCRRGGMRQDRSECWGPFLEELRAHVAANADPDAVVRALGQPGFEDVTRTLLYGPSLLTGTRGLPARPRPGGRAAAAGAREEKDEESWLESWLGEEEAGHMQ
ncbi:hypothetical protein TSOC_005192, partial [Tetrabaena socialis]